MEDLRVTPSDKAWEKLTARKKGNSKIFYYAIGIAASISLMAILFWNTNPDSFSNTNPVALSDSNSFSQKPLSNDNQTNENNKEINSELKEGNFTENKEYNSNFSYTNSHNEENITSKNEYPRKISSTPVQTHGNEEEEIQPLESVVTTESTESSQSDLKPKLIYDLTGQNENTKTAQITISHEEAYGREEEVKEEEDKRKVNLKKIFDFAKSIKTNETGIGTLREVKDNLVSPGRKTKNETESD